MYYFIERTNLTTGNPPERYGKRFILNGEPYGTKSSAENAVKRMQKEDWENCPECTVLYKIVPAD